MAAQYKCRKCGSTTFKMSVLQQINVEFLGYGGHEVFEGPAGDMEWDDDTFAFCLGALCHYEGHLHSFENPDYQPN